MVKHQKQRIKKDLKLDLDKYVLLWKLRIMNYI